MTTEQNDSVNGNQELGSEPVVAPRGYGISEREAQSRTAGDLFVWNVINMPSAATFYPVATPRDGYDLINKMANQQLEWPWVSNNAFGLSELQENGDLDDWYDDQGRDVDEAFDETLEPQASEQKG